MIRDMPPVVVAAPPQVVGAVLDSVLDDMVFIYERDGSDDCLVFDIAATARIRIVRQQGDGSFLVISLLRNPALFDALWARLIVLLDELGMIVRAKGKIGFRV